MPGNWLSPVISARRPAPAAGADSGWSSEKPWRRGHVLERLPHRGGAVALPGMDGAVAPAAAGDRG